MCTRVVHVGEDGRVVTGRSMDWKLEIATNLWAFPRGMRREGRAGPASMTWTSQYGSVIASGYDVCSTDGVNEAGLAANLLWLAESEYPEDDDTGPAIALSLWAQYVLDMFGSVAETVDALTATPLSVRTASVPGQDRLATLHLSISDRSGDNAIVEYIGGRQVIHHDRSYRVMTNSPTFDEQLAVNAYWKGIGGAVMLPGTNRAADRFVRASFYIDAIPTAGDALTSVAAVLSVVRNVSVPYGITTAEEPNISTTRWRTAVDHQDLRYVFESALSPNTFWVDLDRLDLAAGSAVRTLALGEGAGTVHAGETSALFAPAEPFAFLSTGT